MIKVAKNAQNNKKNGNDKELENSSGEFIWRKIKENKLYHRDSGKIFEFVQITLTIICINFQFLILSFIINYHQLS